MTDESLTLMDIARLVSDPSFQRLAEIQDTPNMFRAVGRSFTETWHSRFLGWMLDPKGSHGLGAFPLQQFLVAVAQGELVPEDAPATFATPAQLAHLALTSDFSDAVVLPNERYSKEKSVANVGNLDIAIQTLNEEDDEDVENGDSAYFIVVEMKVDAKLSEGQARKYADYAASQVGEGSGRAVCIFVSRTSDQKTTISETVDDSRWFAIDFQSIHDSVLLQCLAHPELKPSMKPLLEHYIINMRDENKNGRLAVTNEERKLAKEILNIHQKTLRLVAELLKEDESLPAELAPALKISATDVLPLEIRVEGKVVSGRTVPEFLLNVLELILQRPGSTLSLPFLAGKSRYLIAEEPVHPNGNDFFAPRTKDWGGRRLYIETNTSRPSAIRQAQKLLASAGLQLGIRQ